MESLELENTPQQVTDSILTVDGMGNVGYRDISTLPTSGSLTRARQYAIEYELNLY